VCTVQPWFIQEDLHSTHMTMGADSSSETHGYLLQANNRQRHSLLHEHSSNQSHNFPSAQTHFPPLGTRTARAVSHCPSHVRSAVSIGQSFLSKPTAYPKHSLSFSLRRVLPILHNHFEVYCLYCKITSTCTAPTAQLLRCVLPILYNHFAVYCPYCTITSPLTAPTAQSLRRVLPLL